MEPVVVALEKLRIPRILAFVQNAVMVILFTVFLLLENIPFFEKIGIAFENRISSGIRKVARDVVIQVSPFSGALRGSHSPFP